VVDTIDLYVSSTQNISIEKSFDVISIMILTLSWTDNDLFYDDWGSSGNPLTTGIDFRYVFDGVEHSLLESNRWKSIEDIGTVMFDWCSPVLINSKDPQTNTCKGQYSFDKFSAIGIDNRTGFVSDVFFIIEENIQTGIDELTITFEGYNIIGKTDDKTQSIQTDKRNIGFITPDNVFTAGMIILMSVVVYAIYYLMFKD